MDALIWIVAIVVMGLYYGLAKPMRQHLARKQAFAHIERLVAELPETERQAYIRDYLSHPPVALRNISQRTKEGVL